MRVVLSAIVVALGGTAVAPAAHGAAGGLSIHVLSNTRADLVSDGQALVEIRHPAATDPARLRITLNGRDVADVFAVRADGRFTGLVSGLRNGINKLRAAASKRASTTLRIKNHPRSGPIFGGPQPSPWRCQKAAVDVHCNQAPEYTLLYRSSDPTVTDLQPYDPQNPPSDVATATTENGETVPFIVRQELGYLARDQYKILVLFDPSKPWDRWSPQPTWNHKLLVTGGGGCGGDYHTSGAPTADFSGTFNDLPVRDSYVNALGRGFAVMSHALANTGHNCNVATEAEALMMLKEHLIETYGDVRYTIGTGCSGGSIVQHTVANAYPGAVYDGLIVTCSYPDTFTAGAQFADYHLLRLYFEDPSRWAPGVLWSPHQWAAVEGHITHVNAIVADQGLFKAAVNPVGDCAGEASYNPQSNPGGVRCSILDFMINVLGPRPQEVWTAQEKAAGRSFAGVPFSNTGIQYGLRALQAGLITIDQFLDLNEKVGGLDMDAQLSPQRMTGDDSAVANAYRAGLVNEGDNMEDVAIIAHGGPDPGIAHDFAHAYWLRDRLDRYQGHHANQVLWVGAAPLIGDLSWPTEALLAMDRWLAAVEADRSDRPRSVKITENRPADVRDRCQYTPGSTHIAALDNVCLPDLVHLRLGTPREVAGGDRLNDILKCRLRPIDPSEYGPLGLSAGQMARLKAIFPDGVCSWTAPGIGQQAATPWMTYFDRKRRVAYGGRAMPRPPRSTR